MVVFYSKYGHQIKIGLTYDAQEKISCNLVLKLKVFISKYLQEHYTWCITRAALFFKNVPGTFFNATHQVKAIAIGVSEANPLVEIGDCCSCVHLHVFLPNLS